MPIFDQGYQHWTGPLSGHTWRWLAVARHGVRATLQNRYIRMLLFVAWLPALVLVTFLALWGLLEQQVESVLTFLSGMNLPKALIAQPQDDVLLVQLPAGRTPELVWQIASDLGEQVRHLRPQRSTLEEVFLQAVGEKV